MKKIKMCLNVKGSKELDDAIIEDLATDDPTDQTVGAILESLLDDDEGSISDNSKDSTG